MKPVSIHAPTRGATKRAIGYSHPSEVSIHAPTRGATRDALSPAAGGWFQSTRPRGARPEAEGSADVPDCFNPRAHAGRDGFRIRAYSTFCSFNPRAHAGRDAYTAATAYDSAGFNPRAHAGRDDNTRKPWAANMGFNPRAHAGRDNF